MTITARRTRPKVSAAGLALMVLAATPASAENWVEAARTSLVSVQVDIDSLHHIGSVVTYWTRTWSFGGVHPDYAYVEAVNCADHTHGYGILDSTAPGRGGVITLDRMDFGASSDPTIQAEIAFICNR